MKTTLFKAMTVGAIALASQSAFASDGTINFTGELTTQTCSINGTAADGNRNVSVTLPAASQSNLRTVGSTSGETAFQIALTSCTPTSGTVHTRFESGPNVDVASGELLTSGAGSSAGLRIQLLNQDRTVIAVGAADVAQNSAPGTIATGAVTLNYIARYHNINSTPLAVGAVTSSVTYSMAYN
ncbi:type 1 fimbrial protein [Lysobacter sp. S4-A87]|uniref:fimbrial protein n=1 Tax=Lysobacter sp. S4-A87 TaxID=2925843 RepID=UPI001F53273A|nr:fimbrial protein [Lysobacter sp. S4-A87]UNK48145.1 type 1 fimbrial protein [Lysobacter sp. S4-A87]